MPRSRIRRSASPLVLIGALVAGAFLVLIGVSMAQEFRRRLVLQQHIRTLRADIGARESRIRDLQHLREYLNSDAYVERVAREQLNYQRPGERVVVVPNPPSPSPTPVARAKSEWTISPARAWLLLLFKARGGLPPTSSSTDGVR